ncbi:MAG: hypothetical protein CEE38_00750 [Planctomycetes bacterium B3_Pla]|nr:MAG: hypothetical protein CEE38_00750 [Planctomycetes bacterium B3_Pla]
MLTLIKREIQDHIAYFLGAVILTATIIVLALSVAYHAGPRNEAINEIIYLGLSLPVIVILMTGFSSMGVSQMYTDRARKVSAFLSTLPVSRSQILLARIITGALAILTVVLPLAATGMALRYLFAPPIPVFSGMLIDIFAAIFLVGFACYCLGLLTGWTTSKTATALACLALTCVIVSLILVKGLGPSTKVILILFIVACLTRTWQKFMSTSL